MIEIPKRSTKQSPNSKSSAVKKEEDQSHLTQFTQNPNLGNVIKQLELRQPHLQKLNLPKNDKIKEEKERHRKFKKPLDSLASRKERIEMVKGLAPPSEALGIYPQDNKGDGDKKPVFPQAEELDSTLTHKEIQDFSERYHITWQQIFQLDAEFWSLITIESEEKKKEEDKLAGKNKDVLELPSAQREDSSDGDDEEKPKEKKIGMDADGPSISLKIFLGYTTSLADKFKDVNKRLISAFGIDTSNDNVRIEWDQFLNLKCFLELFTLQGQQLEDVWLKALDPRGLAMVPFADFEDFLERLARGSMSDKETPVSTVFSCKMMELLELEKCIKQTADNRNVDIHKLRKKVKD